MRLVLDTNVLLAAYLSRGHCHDLVEHCARQHTLITSAFILNEFREKLVGKLRVPPAKAAAAVALLAGRMHSVEPLALPGPVCRDPDDDWVLATTRAGACSCLVTGDKDLLALERYEGVDILKPAQFWSYEARFTPR